MGIAEDDLEGTSLKPTSTSSTAIGAITAGGRSVIYQLTSFYLRTPVKLFKPARFDYFHYVRVILTGDSNVSNSKNNSNSNLKTNSKFIIPYKYSSIIENSSLGLLTKALNKYGWKVIPDRILPPLLANSATGVVLYSTYLTTLTNLSPTGTISENYVNVFNPWNVFNSGFLAGLAQSIISTPIDAIYTRSSTAEIFESIKRYNNLWLFGFDKLKEIGLIGCYSGFTLVAIKESFGFAIYFSTFELIKGNLSNLVLQLINGFRRFKFRVKETFEFQSDTHETAPIVTPAKFITMKEEKWIRRAFIFVGGVSAALLLQVFQYPFTKIQKVHFSRLEAFDIFNKSFPNNSKYLQDHPLVFSTIVLKHSKRSYFHIYLHSYLDTFSHIRFLHKTTNDLSRWLYRGFVRRTIATIPGTTMGLILLDYMRAKLEDNILTDQMKLR